MRLEKLIPKEVTASDVETTQSMVSNQSPPFLFVNKIFTMSKHDFKKN